MHPTVRTWLGKSREELDEIYRNAQPGEIPEGDTQGTAILAGSAFSKIVAAFARMFAWQGKVFDLFSSDRQSGILVNKITFFSLTFIIAKVYRGKSWMESAKSKPVCILARSGGAGNMSWILR
jgi:hypothetical protein